MNGPTVTITPDALGELLDAHFEATRDNEALHELHESALHEIGRLRYEVKVFRGGSAWFAVALAVSIFAHILRSAV